MGTRIRRAMGWGMTWEAFTVLSPVPQGDRDLYDVFGEATDEQLTVPLDERQWGVPNVPSVMETRLLAKGYTEGGRRDVEIGHPTDLFSLVGMEDTTHVIFYPGLTYQRMWFRRDDDLDYAFERWRDDFDADPMRIFVRFTEFGHYPLANYLMDVRTGEPIEWGFVGELKKRTDWAPAVPTEIRWYLKKLNVMDDNGINQLRPMIAQWWS